MRPSEAAAFGFVALFVGLGRVVLSRRERMVMLEPRDKRLAALVLRYPYEVRSGDEVFEHIPDVKLDDPELS